MMQIYMTMTSSGEALLTTGMVSFLGNQLIEVVENGFGLQGFDDVAFTVLGTPRYTKGEADVQIEIRYTAGEDRYNQGKPFDPSMEEQKAVARSIGQAFAEFLKKRSIPSLSLSVWFKPYYNSLFAMWD